jgi:hypothetical protein
MSQTNVNQKFKVRVMGKLYVDFGEDVPEE